MKRRLCLGNALIGDTKYNIFCLGANRRQHELKISKLTLWPKFPSRIAILDEPSSGLDPESRRELWNILIEMRKENTILITTHYMEEAEALSDYIFIMSRGAILCHGNALKLKRQYAHGYVLRLMLAEQRGDKDAVLRRVREHVGEACVKSWVKPTLCVSLPYARQADYVPLLRWLEANGDQLGVESLSMTDASLEDVFLK